MLELEGGWSAVDGLQAVDQLFHRHVWPVKDPLRLDDLITLRGYSIQGRV